MTRLFRDTDPFHNTAAVITGSSSGIGRSIAIELARRGVTDILVHFRRNREGAEQTASKIEELGGRAMIVQADLSCDRDRQTLVDEAFMRLGSIQTWVNNAGADVLTGSAGDLSFDQKLRLMMDVDVIGTIALSRLLVPRLLDQQPTEHPPSIVYLSWDQSSAGMEGDAGQMFGPVKAAVAAYASSLAQTVAPNVRVNTVAPGWIQTSWGESTGGYWNDRARGQSLMNRWGKPEDVAGAVCFVADPLNSFITGQTIEVNGGWNRRFDRAD